MTRRPLGIQRRAPRACVAYHEAGHAVAALGLGLAIEVVTIVPEQDALGSVTLRAPADEPEASSRRPQMDPRRRMAVRVIHAFYAVTGEVAEEVAIGAADEIGLQGDRLTARDAFEEVWDLTEGVEPSAWRHVVRDAAEAFLRENWWAVERIADALLVRGAIAGATARELVGHLPAPDLSAIESTLEFWTNRVAVQRKRNNEGYGAGND